MLRRSLQLSFLLAVMALSYTAVSAQNKNVRINFARGASQATKSGVIKGYATVKYTFRVQAGQRVSVKLRSPNRFMYFSFNGEGNETTAWEGNVRESGDYTVTVFLMRAEARRGKTANYTLTVKAGFINP